MSDPWDYDVPIARDPDEPCPHHCGYYDQGQDLLDHVRYEHRRCPFCGREPNGESWDDPQYPVSHKPDCIRLAPGHRYADEPSTEDGDK